MLITARNFNLELDILVLKWFLMIFNLLNVLSHPAVLTGRVIAILTALQSSENAKFKGFKNSANSSIVSKVSSQAFF